MAAYAAAQKSVTSSVGSGPTHAAGRHPSAGTGSARCRRPPDQAPAAEPSWPCSVRPVGRRDRYRCHHRRSCGPPSRLGWSAGSQVCSLRRSGRPSAPGLRFRMPGDSFPDFLTENRCHRQRQDHRSEAPDRLLRARKVLNATTRLVRSGAGRPSELGQLGERRQDPYLTRTKFDNQGGVVLDADDPAKPVLIVGHLVLHGKLLNRGLGGPGVEGTRGQMAPGCGAGRLHHLQYAPSRRSPLVSGLPVSPRPRHRQPDGRPRQGTDRATAG